MFSLLRKAWLLFKTSKIVFSPFYSPSMTWKYRALLGVTRGYKGLQGITGGYKGLQKVTGGYKGRYGVTRDDRGLHTIMQTFF